MTDPLNRTTTYRHDAVGRVTGIQRPDGTQVDLSHDGNGNLTILTTGARVEHIMGYNRVNLESSYTTPLSGGYGYTHDRDRRLKEVLFPSGKKILDVYDEGLLQQVQTQEGNIDLSYFSSTKVRRMGKGQERIVYGYDGPLVTSETSSGALNQAIGYPHDNYFRVMELAYAGESVGYKYDDDGSMIATGDYIVNRNTTNGLPEAVRAYSPSAPAQKVLNLIRTFNGYGELDSEDFSVDDVTASSWAVARNDGREIVERTETIDGPSSTYSYTYGPGGRLLTVEKDGTLAEKYRHGPNGTRTFETNTLRGITAREMTHSEEDHLLTSGDTTYRYDLDGLLTSKSQGTQTTLYSHSSRGELLSVTLPDGTPIEYVYGPLGRRIAKKVNGAVTEKYLWQGMTCLLAVFDADENLVVRFQYADSRMPLAMTVRGANYYLSYDQVGSLRAVSDTLGETVTDSNPTDSVPFGFAGGRSDHDTGLARFGYRDYDPDRHMDRDRSYSLCWWGYQPVWISCE